MTVQPSLFDRAQTIDDAFHAFHVEHPEVYRHLVRLAYLAKSARSTDRIGIGMLYEVLRWETMVGDLTGATFKLNNNFRSRYARLIADREPGLETIFETRELRS